jgi:hypothetical protein
MPGFHDEIELTVGQEVVGDESPKKLADYREFQPLPPQHPDKIC